MRFLPLIFILSLTSCTWLRGRETVVTVGDVAFNGQYYADRLVEKLKNLDSVAIKDPAVTSQMTGALTNELIIEGFLYDWARERHIVIGPEDIKRFLSDNLQSPMGVRGDFLFEASPGQDLLQDAVKIQVIKEKLLADLEQKMSFTDEELKAFYKDNSSLFPQKKIHLKQIFLEKEQDAEMVMQFLKSGKLSFEDLARKYSLTPEAQQGGDLGWINLGQGPTIDPLFNAPSGVHNKIVKSPQGFHVYKIVKVEKLADQPFPQLKDAVLRVIKKRKLDDAYLLWLQERVKTVKVKTNDGLIQSLSPAYQENI